MTGVHIGNGLMVVDIRNMTARQVGELVDAQAERGWMFLTATDRFVFLVDK